MCRARGVAETEAERRPDPHWTSLDTVEIADGRITAFRRLVNPEKLAHIGHI